MQAEQEKSIIEHIFVIGYSFLGIKTQKGLTQGERQRFCSSTAANRSAYLKKREKRL